MQVALDFMLVTLPLGQVQLEFSAEIDGGAASVVRPSVDALTPEDDLMSGISIINQTQAPGSAVEASSPGAARRAGGEQTTLEYTAATWNTFRTVLVKVRMPCQCHAFPVIAVDIEAQNTISPDNAVHQFALIKWQKNIAV